jgi:hypothetical protein
MHNAIYQNCLALDYLLASEGGIFGKFNLSNCYFQIDDEENVIEEITDQMRKIAHYPVQTWKGWNPGDYLADGFQLWGIQNPHKCYAFDFRGLPGFVLPAPLIVRSVSSLIKATVERKTASPVMMLWKYKPLNQDDAL